MSLPLKVEPSPQMSTPSSCIARTSRVPVTARPSGVVLKYVRPPERMWKAPQAIAARPSSTSGALAVDGRESSAPYCSARSGTRDVGLVVLAEVGGVGARDRALLAHPRDGDRGVEAAGEGDADALADGEGGQDLAHVGIPSMRVVRRGVVGSGGLAWCAAMARNRSASAGPPSGRG